MVHHDTGEWMGKNRRSSLLNAASALFLTIALVIGAIGVRANDLRWHQGPVVIKLSPTHGLHEMDVFLLGLALASALIALIAAVIAKR